MGTSGSNAEDQHDNSSSSSSSSLSSGGIVNTIYGVPLPSSLSFLLDYSGRLHSESAINNNEASTSEIHHDHEGSSLDSTATSGEVAIRINGAMGSNQNQSLEDGLRENKGGVCVVNEDGEGSSGILASERVPLVSSSSSSVGGGSTSGQGDVGAGNGLEGNSWGLPSRESNDFQQFAKWLEQILPFSLLLLVVFIRQHLLGFIITIWISIVMLKSNEIVKRQTALKGDRKVSFLISISFVFMLHVMCIYWWYQDDDLLYSPLILLPPKATPHFWHAIFVVLINDILVRQAAMSFKCLLLIYFKNDRGHSFRLQAQILTLIEHTLLLYRALLPTPVWYRFFLNREYGSLFSSLTTGLYLTFKLTSAVEKVQCFSSALKSIWGTDIHYGVYATKEQVNAAGDLCAICQEKTRGPILLRCKHIFCEECVSEWFDRERTCPLCRALVRAGDIRSFGDGSTSLFFQLC